MKIEIEEIKWILENDFKIHPDFSMDTQTNNFMDYLGSNNSELREGSLAYRSYEKIKLYCNIFPFSVFHRYIQDD